MAERHVYGEFTVLVIAFFHKTKQKWRPNAKSYIPNNKQPVLLRFVRDYFCNLKIIAHNIQYCNVLRDNDDVMLVR